eukprot:scaffold11917_cov128-Isochrysis_galbana.AAC.3
MASHGTSTLRLSLRCCSKYVIVDSLIERPSRDWGNRIQPETFKEQHMSSRHLHLRWRTSGRGGGARWRYSGMWGAADRAVCA